MSHRDDPGGNSMAARRVAVTGLGMISALGNNIPETWDVRLRRQIRNSSDPLRRRRGATLQEWRPSHTLRPRANTLKLTGYPFSTLLSIRSHCGPRSRAELGHRISRQPCARTRPSSPVRAWAASPRWAMGWQSYTSATRCGSTRPSSFLARCPTREPAISRWSSASLVPPTPSPPLAVPPTMPSAKPSGWSATATLSWPSPAEATLRSASAC